MRGGFGGMLSVRVKGGEAAAIATAANVKLWKRATSLGGVESLIEHRASIEGPGSPCPPDLLRLSVGLESTDDLIGDLEQAMGSRMITRASDVLANKGSAMQLVARRIAGQAIVAARVSQAATAAAQRQSRGAREADEARPAGALDHQSRRHHGLFSDGPGVDA